MAGKKVTLGVRSEHVLVDANAPHAGTVSITEPLGDATLVHFDYGQGKTLVAKVPPTTTLGPGSTLRFRFAPEACHLFDAAGGARLN
jgi:multiple sugar transport system ATP-binding protein